MFFEKAIVFVFKNVFFEGAILKSLMKDRFIFNTSLLTFVCNPYSEKESLKIRKVNNKNSNFT